MITIIDRENLFTVTTCIDMGNTTNIQWTDATWNIARGCTKVDSDCARCYMYRDSLQGTRYKPKEVIRTKTVFDMPLKFNRSSECWDGPPLIFTSSLTDWAHPAIDSYRHEMCDIIRARPDLHFQLLTKLPERIPGILPRDWGEGYPNVWLGTSVGHNKALKRIDLLCEIPAVVRFVSFEPLHERIQDAIPIDWSDGSSCINWAIIGGESGYTTGKYAARPCDPEWMFQLIAECRAGNVPIFVKQLGTVLAKKLKLNDRHGGDIKEWPLAFRIRQFPTL